LHVQFVLPSLQKAIGWRAQGPQHIWNVPPPLFGIAPPTPPTPPTPPIPPVPPVPMRQLVPQAPQLAASCATQLPPQHSW